MSACDAAPTICACGEPRHHHLPTMTCRCGVRIALDPAINEWRCPTCQRRYIVVRDAEEAG